MDKILFVDANNAIHNYGLRQITSIALMKGFDVSLLFVEPQNLGLESPFPKETVDEIIEFTASFDTVGFSVYSPYSWHAGQLSIAIQRHLQIPVFWGGIHATVAPLDSLQYADIVCIGDGEETIVELLAALRGDIPIESVLGIYYKRDGTPVSTPPRRVKPEVIAEDYFLDKYPFPYWAEERQYYVQDNHIQQVTTDTIRAWLHCGESGSKYFGLTGTENYQYQTLSTRGCPYSCTYCCHQYLRKLYGRKGYIRKRSIDNLIQELVLIRQKYPFINFINIHDDDFFERTIEELTEFRDKYKSIVNLPFKCSFAPSSFSLEKVDLMIDAGMIFTRIGIQSGSIETNRNIYRRAFSISRLTQILSYLTLHTKIRIVCDMIFDNPFEGPKDLSETIRLFRQLPPGYSLQCFSLTFYPGTEIQELAIKKGLIDENPKNYMRRYNHVERHKYTLQLCFWTMKLKAIGWLNRPLINSIWRFFSSPLVVQIFETRFGHLLLDVYGFIRKIVKR